MYKVFVWLVIIFIGLYLGVIIYELYDDNYMLSQGCYRKSEGFYMYKGVQYPHYVWHCDGKED